MRRYFLTFLFIPALSSLVCAEGKISRSEYVQQWNQTAISEMQEHGIPASIALAQGILESANGNSTLATEGNNHFGIKCHGWEGKKMYLDDDQAGECFRVYKNAKESYEDHSDFLKKHERYKFLFTYESDDYKSWAQGLKKAGYATNPQYPERLVAIIEDLGLDQYDKVSKPQILAQPNLIATAQGNTHQVMEHQRKVNYVVVKEGDTFYKIAKEFGLTLRQLQRYNDFDKEKYTLKAGDVVYLERKKGFSLFKKDQITLEKDMTVNELAQLTAVKAVSIKNQNDIEEANPVLKKGLKVTLR